MNTFLITLYLVFFGLAAYTFVGYPALLWLLQRLPQRRPVTDPAFEPMVTIIVAAYNEEKLIGPTLKSLLRQEYPVQKRRIMVFSDGSSDHTDVIVKSYQVEGVELVRFEGRLGKTECQNRMVEQSSGEIVAFADGNLVWEPSALRHLVQVFADGRVSASTGTLHLVKENTLEKTNEGLFRRMDDVVKRGESRIHSTIGVNGPIYAVRRSDYIRLAPAQVSDLVLPILLAAQGKRVRYVPEAVALEPASSSVWQEFVRKRRLVTQGFVALPMLWSALSPLRRPLLFWMLCSHKVLRWIGIELLSAAFLVSLLLIDHPVFRWVVLAEGVLLVFAGVSLYLVQRSTTRLASLQALGYFMLTNVAGFLGLVDYLRGQRAATWNTQRT